MTDYCEGCATSTEDQCDMSNINKEGECPCTECIIKMICRQGCNGYNEWRSTVVKELKRSYRSN